MIIFLFTTLNRRLRTNKKKLGINKPLITHILRHTHVSKLAELGGPLYSIQNRVDHGDAETTRDIYSHVTRNAKSK
ncbi:MAG TPA: tyrosine-type recombinase/integrase [Candidatus Limosilactobacillus intestinigallinarum]|nr:tyrosine-type recombinase/integrase [Candidatus Limosilactobacillus intestinigallinarum]